ncbi:MAG: hypothetical protein ACYTFQ_31650 [Planctomycetota bacterium]|jgi:hypothetical protein
MQNFGIVRPGKTLYINWHTFDSNDPANSIAVVGLALADVRVYKNGGTTERASTSGFTLLDTDGIDFAGNVGIGGVSIDLSDNTTANFWAAGAHYMVVIGNESTGGVTIDGGNINFIAATFTIGLPDALLNTTIAAYTSTDNFTLNAGSATDDTYNGCILVAHDLSTANLIQIGVIEDYTGSTKTVNLKADPGIFTMAANDHISILPPTLLPVIPGTMVDVTTSGGVGIDWANVENPTTAVDLSGTDIPQRQSPTA